MRDKYTMEPCKITSNCNASVTYSLLDIANTAVSCESYGRLSALSLSLSLYYWLTHSHTFEFLFSTYFLGGTR
jgi:hypothetical protein